MAPADRPWSTARFFASLEQLHGWFERNHATARELWIAYPKKGIRRKGVTYAEAVEEALCFGWVDGQ
ncbi:MAG TPA: bacteriocin-protection protein, partial [Thermoplasmata archaeon]|nr:bacteriocin-protection protein [Thermoplasmata archaeon]